LGSGDIVRVERDVARESRFGVVVLLVVASGAPLVFRDSRYSTASLRAISKLDSGVTGRFRFEDIVDQMRI
jgi:hypothetical protein